MIEELPGPEEGEVLERLIVPSDCSFRYDSNSIQLKNGISSLYVTSVSHTCQVRKKILVKTMPLRRAFYNKGTTLNNESFPLFKAAYIHSMII